MRLFSDQKRLLLTSYQAQGAEIGDSLADEAVAQAYRGIGNCMPWSYLHRRAQITTNEPYRTGTIGYVASTKIVTLTGGTWPSWVAQSLMLIGQTAYAVDTVISSTQLKLKPNRSPAANVVGSGYTLMQIEYTLPTDFLRLEELVQMGTIWTMFPMEGGSQLSSARFFPAPSRPWQYLLRGSTYFGGRLCLELAPPPNGVYVYDISYFAQPRKRTLATEYTTGSVSVSGTAVVGTGTTFTQAMVGCQLRQGSATAVPVGEYGANGSANENTILSVEDATHLTLMDAGVSLGPVLYLIDDPIDIERNSMDEVFCRMCEYNFATLVRSDTRAERELEMKRALDRARASDVRSATINTSGAIPTFAMLARANMVQ